MTTTTTIAANILQPLLRSICVSLTPTAKNLVTAELYAVVHCSCAFVLEERVFLGGVSYAISRQS